MSTMTSPTPAARTVLAQGHHHEARIRRTSCGHLMGTGYPVSNPRLGVAASRRPSAHRTSRLTRRGRFLVVGVLLAVLAALTIAGALRASASSSAPPPGWSETIVQPGDTLWSLAVATGDSEDPRVLIDQIRQVNALSSAQVQAGQRLWLPSS